MTNRLLTAAGRAARANAPGCPFRARTVDLHVHSTCSDGVKTPEELARMAQKTGVEILALCDHDSTGGVRRLQSALEGSGIVLIPGVEVSTGQGGSTHILCYGENVLGPDMQRFLSRMAQERTGRAEEMIRLLAREGAVIPEERRAELLASPSVGRPHIARALIELGCVNTVKQAFDRYLSQGRPAYVPRKLLPTADAVDALSRMQVLTVLAHPVRMGLEHEALHALIRSLKELGLHGLEAWHPSASSKAAAQLDQLARQCGLIVTGGSDYHGDPGSTVHMGRLPSGWERKSEDMDALLTALTPMTNTKGATSHV